MHAEAARAVRRGEWSVRVGLAAGALVHLPPLAGLLGAGVLQRMYGVTIVDPALGVLLQHRALLFGVLAGLCIAASWRPALRGAAFGATSASLAVFLLLVALAPETLATLRVIALADVLALPLVLWGAWSWRRATRG